MSDPGRSQAILNAVTGHDVKRILDVGCGAGQEMSPLIDQGVLGVGIDLDCEVGQVGRRLLAGRGLVFFVRSRAEFLPFTTDCFDVLICRLTLPYTDNACAIGEMARVLRPGGLLILKIHAAPYYLRKFWRGLADHDILSSIHAGRVLVAGLFYHAFGIQIRKFVGTETFQSVRLLRQELTRNNLVIQRQMPDSDSLAPSFLIRKIVNGHVPE